MRIFCREDHEIDELVALKRDIPQELLEARATLEKVKLSPLSDFAQETYKAMRIGPFGPLYYSVDSKDDAISRLKARIAELEILVSGVKNG